jgi:hypothetical protein
VMLSNLYRRGLFRWSRLLGNTGGLAGLCSSLRTTLGTSVGSSTLLWDRCLWDSLKDSGLRVACICSARFDFMRPRKNDRSAMSRSSRL